jgi:hypothetical protein
MRLLEVRQWVHGRADERECKDGWKTDRERHADLGPGQ